MSDTQERVCAIITEHLGCDPAVVAADPDRPITAAESEGRDAKLASLGGDSLDHVELVMAFEEEFNIEISDEAADDPRLNTVNGIVAYLREQGVAP